MPSRRDVFVNGGIYHIFNKSIDGKNIFKDTKLSRHFLDLVFYYRSLKANLRYSQFSKLSEIVKKNKLKELYFEKYFKVEIICYCLMPNHFHLLIKQKKENGVLRYISDIINAFTRHYNILNDRKGPIFLTQFKSKIIKSREQLIHVSRYIHLNPYSSGFINSFNELLLYPFSSSNEYFSFNKNNICNKQLILDEFGGKPESYKKFILDNAEYQKTLEYLKHVDKW